MTHSPGNDTSSVAETVWIETQDGLRLEGLLSLPRQPWASGLVLCHPHPGMGGTMQAPLISFLSRGLAASGHAVLKFNFRGVGGSSGEQTAGDEEMMDVAAAIQLVRSRLNLSNPFLVGWSFGAVMALRYAVGDPGLSAVVAIAPPVTVPKYDVRDLPVTAPTLWVVGDKDPYCSFTELEGVTGTKTLVRGANHLFWAREAKPLDTILSFLSEVGT